MTRKVCFYKLLNHIFLAACLLWLIDIENSNSWNNGPSGDANTDESHSNCENIPYSTHDWIADHARAILPEEERKWLDENIKLYLLGTEAPDNRNIPDSCNAPNSGYDDRNSGHSVKWNSDFSDFLIEDNGSKHDRAAFRAKDEYLKAQSSIRDGKLNDAAFYAGAMAHYIGDVSQYGHSVDFENHHSDYESLIRNRTESFEGGHFEIYLVTDGLKKVDAYDTVVIISKSTAGGDGNIKSAAWMDSHYKDKNQEYWDSVGSSLNLGVNILADVLHTLYIDNQEFINNPNLVGESEPVFYTVKQGDTLGSIAREFLGDGRRWRTIWVANRDKIDNPSNLQIGTQLVIP